MEIVCNNVCQNQLNEAHSNHEEVVLRNCTAVDRELDCYCNTTIYQGGYKAVSVCAEPTQEARTALYVYGGHYDILHSRPHTTLETHAYEDTITTTDGKTSQEVSRCEPVKVNTIIVDFYAGLSGVRAHELYIDHGRVEIKHDCQIDEINVKTGVLTIMEKGVKRVSLWNDGARVLVSREVNESFILECPNGGVVEVTVLDDGYTLLKRVTT